MYGIEPSYYGTHAPQEHPKYVKWQQLEYVKWQQLD